VGHWQINWLNALIEADHSVFTSNRQTWTLFFTEHLCCCTFRSTAHSTFWCHDMDTK